MELDISGHMPITIIVYDKCMYLESFTIFCSEEFRRTQNFQKKFSSALTKLNLTPNNSDIDGCLVSKNFPEERHTARQDSPVG